MSGLGNTRTIKFNERTLTTIIVEVQSFHYGVCTCDPFKSIDYSEIKKNRPSSSHIRVLVFDLEPYFVKHPFSKGLSA